ncbi:FomA family porin-like outer membrane protein [Candidatus Cetobacterium colombiensis]|uniref:Porin domain-containing protein n=1 Tax=Candidatus Cetobacterium colombiensis TaxID=3073100 RepID=A0ABU4W801_9FUSO|nr:hypothetical protein [Candidatus Cetobacterium colombiensis]MDX8335641.1 hypothetical protein [Candidatus Cetobacterium colombiensis]
MKKNKLFFLAAMCTLTSLSFAKESLETPNKVETTEIEVVEIIPAKETFKLSGEIEQQLEYRGNPAGTPKDSRSANFRFRPVQGKLKLSEELSMDFRARLQTRAESGQSKNDKSDMRLRWYYDHGNFMDSGVKLISRLRLEKDSPNKGTWFGDTDIDSPGIADTEYKLNYVSDIRVMADLKSLMPSMISKFQIGPAYRYTWNSDVSGLYGNGIGFDLETTLNLPWKFKLDTNVYGTQWYFGHDIASQKGVSTTKDNAFVVSYEVLLKNNWDLYKFNNNKTKLNFGIEYGLDPAQNSDTKIFKTTSARNKKPTDGYYYLKARNILGLSHKYTDATTMYINFVEEYGNRKTAANEARDWSWAPEVIVGWVTKF